MPFEYMPSSAEDPMPSDVPEREIEVTYARSSGPGGQNVNKRSTKAIITWNVRESSAYTGDEMALIEAGLANRINKQGEVVIHADTTRSREQNRAAAIETLQRLVREALTPEAERIPTKPSRAVKKRRLEEKRIHSAKKRERGRKDWE